MIRKMHLLYWIYLLSGIGNAQILMPVQEFQTDILVHGTGAPTNVWFAPNFQTPIDWSSTGGCPDGRIGYTSSWNNCWRNFVRLPALNCTGSDTVVLVFDVSHSYFPAHTNDWCRFYIWADDDYKHNVVSVVIDSVDVTYDSGINGKGFKFTEIRSCAPVAVMFDISGISDKSDILFYIEASCGYNNSNLFSVWYDNMSVLGFSGGTVSVSEGGGNGNLFVYPSPVDDYLTIQTDNVQIQEHYLEVIDLHGRRVMSEMFFGNICTINVSGLSSGFYNVVLRDRTDLVLKAGFLKK